MLYSPTCGPNTMAAASTMPRSLSISARPTSRLVYLLRIIATMSVPPVEAPMLNTIALPMAGRITAKQSSRKTSLVSGADSGNASSHRLTKKDSAMEE